MFYIKLTDLEKNECLMFVHLYYLNNVGGPLQLVVVSSFWYIKFWKCRKYALLNLKKGEKTQYHKNLKFIIPLSLYCIDD